MKKWVVRLHEVALYEIEADTKEEAERLVFDESLGDFVGYDDKAEILIDSELLNDPA